MRKFSKMFHEGVKDNTFFESCGVADVITSCFGGRNRKVAEAHVLTGKSFEELEKELLNGQKLQGTLTAREIHLILQAKGLTGDFPLFTQVYRICYEGEDSAAIVNGKGPVHVRVADRTVTVLHNGKLWHTNNIGTDVTWISSSVGVAFPSVSNPGITLSSEQTINRASTANLAKPTASVSSLSQTSTRSLTLLPSPPAPLSESLCMWVEQLMSERNKQQIQQQQQQQQQQQKQPQLQQQRSFRPLRSSSPSDMRSSRPPAVPFPSSPSKKRAAPRSLVNPRLKIRESKDTAFVSDDDDNADDYD
ncbi:glycerol-3-phosphate dehydrogenase [Physocladia obscura]|uniref:glycerol-3-phosphate dehydrogenase (NAD(+)) n=1 Tax=Physocladia obscura TaxID=109957 RepID=A0AAD5SPW5_9FUNG|nr:glycerol-3-phosphate dehydrogenase [Physocladia obscura]